MKDQLRELISQLTDHGQRSPEELLASLGEAHDLEPLLRGLAVAGLDLDGIREDAAQDQADPGSGPRQP